jgi:hypothetical protein
MDSSVMYDMLITLITEKKWSTFPEQLLTDCNTKLIESIFYLWQNMQYNVIIIVVYDAGIWSFLMMVMLNM